MRKLLLAICVSLGILASSFSVAQGDSYSWRGYLYKPNGDSAVGHTRLWDTRVEAYGDFRIYQEETDYVFIFLNYTNIKNIYTGFRCGWNPGDREPITGRYIEFLGYRYWIFLYKGESYLGILHAEQ